MKSLDRKNLNKYLGGIIDGCFYDRFNYSMIVGYAVKNNEYIYFFVINLANNNPGSHDYYYESGYNNLWTELNFPKIERLFRIDSSDINHIRLIGCPLRERALRRKISCRGGQ